MEANAWLILQGHYANLNRKPVVFDPVGVGATAFRRTTANGTPILILPTLFHADLQCNMSRVAEQMASKCDKRECGRVGCFGQFGRSES